MSNSADTTRHISARRKGISVRRPHGRARTWTGALVALAVGAAVLTAVAVQQQQLAAAAAPQVGEPGVLPEVDLDSLDPEPISQWGVVGTGNSYTAAKSQVWDFEEIGDRIYVAGIFTGVQRNADDPSSQIVPQAYLAAFDRDSGAYLPTFAPQLDRAVYALEVAPNGNLLVGGEFTQVNGVNRTGLVQLDPATGATVPGFTAAVSATNQPMVRDILRVDQQIYIAGQFSRVPNGGAAQPFFWNAARLNGDTGAIDLGWIPKFLGGIWQVAVDRSQGRVAAAGFFTSVEGQPNTARFAVVTEATGAFIPGLTPFEFNQPTGQKDTVGVVYADGKWWVAGAQHIVQVLDATTNQRVGYIAAGIKGTGNGCSYFYPTCGYTGGGDFQTIEVTAGGKIIGGCHCYGVNTMYNSFDDALADQRFATAVNTADGKRSSGFVPGLKQRSVGTYGLFVDSRGCYYVGGDYNRKANGQWLGGFGRFCRTVQPPASLTGTASGTSARVDWSPSPTQHLPVAYYKVYRDGTFVGDTTGLTFAVSVPNGTTPPIQVRTVDVAGRLSAPATVTPQGAPADNEAPTTPGNAAGSVDGTTVTLTWSESTDLPVPGAVGLSAYLVHRDGIYLGKTSPGTTTFTETGVANGARRYEIRAVDKGNRMSAPAVVNVTVGTPVVDNEPPTVPSNLVGTNPSAGTVDLSWGPSTDLPDPGGVGLSTYLVHRDGVYLGKTSATTFTDTGVADGNRRYEVRAVDRGNRMSAPAVATVAVGTVIVDNEAPTVPANVVGSVAGPGSATITWDPSVDLPNPGGVGLSGYLIHRDWAYVRFIAAGTTTFTDTGVAPGRRRYEVRAVDRGNRISAPAAPVFVDVP